MARSTYLHRMDPTDNTIGPRAGDCILVHFFEEADNSRDYEILLQDIYIAEQYLHVEGITPFCTERVAIPLEKIVYQLVDISKEDITLSHLAGRLVRSSADSATCEVLQPLCDDNPRSHQNRP